MLEKSRLIRYIGSTEQIGGIRQFVLEDGKARGVRAIEIDTGCLRLTILPDRCLDIAQANYKGVPLAWISKSGITSPSYFEQDGLGWLKSFFGGLVTTCGLRNIGKPADGMGLHGRIANTPAEQLCVSANWQDDRYIMQVSGIVREAVVFGENLVLRRTIMAQLGQPSFSIQDQIENQGFRKQEYALCYHCNFGYPLISETAKITGVPNSDSGMLPPTHGIREECIDVKLQGKEAQVGIENKDLGVYLTYTRENLPGFLIWKMAGESDYVIGLEPRTSSHNGIEEIRENGESRFLEPQQTKECHLSFSVRELEMKTDDRFDNPLLKSINNQSSSLLDWTTI